MIYLASPYSCSDPAVQEFRFKVVCRVAARLMRQGHLIFSPIAHTHPIAVEGDLPKGWDFWEKYDHSFLDFCEEIWVVRMQGWDMSRGVKAEMEYMQAQGKPVRFVDPLPEEMA